ncbi:MAG: C25 family cysteine peptidase, partial [Candidatus Woesearchaeota archaeon]|nr:C25 family cysteine peptidase [Candidatus Woesearchaeota archaeon]
TCILSCSCESGYADLDNDISNGCELLPLIAPNKKSMSLYSDKEVFLISDSNWKDVLPFVPVAVWTEGSNIEKYPFLIYHDERYWNFDADSIIYFMQQYNPNKVTIVGETPQELDNLLIAERDFGAGLKQENIKRIDVDEHLFYWESFDTVVYVEDNYELALLASTYASLINAPLIIQGTAPDSADIFTGRDVICVGSVSPIGGSCSEQYTLEQLQAKYKTETNTDKIILINPSDWTAKVSRFLETDKSGYIFDLYSKTSLSAPILASAKHELILSRKAIPDSGKFEDSLNEEDLEKLFIEIDNFIEPHLAEMNYLTIMANLFVIPHRKYSHRAFGSDIYWALDQHFYADTDNDKESDVAVGRITGFTTSDVSSYVARDLFYDAFQKTNNMKFMASSFLGTLEVYTNFLLLVDSWSDYNTVSVTTAEEAYQFNPVEWENQDLIYYTDHGASSWSGIDSEDIPELKNSLVASASCSTVSTMKRTSFWAYAIRKGAIGFAGAVSTTYLSGNYYPFVKNIYQKNYPTIGDAFKAADSSKGNVLMTTLIGDPTLNLGVESRESCITKGDCADNICKMFTCGLQESGESCITNGDCADNTCKMFTCGLQQETEGCILHSHCASGLRCNWFTCKSCKSDDSSCTFNKECCSNDGCRAGTCGLQQDGEACNWNTDCAGNICRKDTCGYQAVGESCNWNTDCADNTCKMGTCGLQKIKEPCITKGDCVADSNCVGPPFDTICSSCLKGSVKVTIFNRGQCCNSWEWIQKAKTCRSSNCPVERHKWCRDSACGKGWFGITKLCVHPNCGSIYQRCEDAVGCGTKNDYQACK